MDDTSSTGWPVTVKILASVARALVREGVSPEEFLRGSNVTPAMLDDVDLYLPYSTTTKLLERAIDLSSDPTIGVTVAQMQTPSGWGVLGYAINCCPTIFDAVKMGMKYHRIGPNINRLRLELHGNVAHWIAEPPMPLKRVLPFAMEQEFVSFCRAAHLLTGKPVSLREARFSYAAPRHAERYTQVLSCPIRFDADDNRLIFNADYLDTPILQGNTLSMTTATRLCEQLMAAHPCSDEMVLRIRNMLVENVGEFPDEERVAARLNITSRTLRNRLKRAGESFQGIRDNVREQVAKEYLRNAPLKVEDIALRLNFSDARGFRRAFRQWTGQSPAEFRQGVRCGNSRTPPLPKPRK